MRVKYLSVKHPKAIELTGNDNDPSDCLPNFHKTGSIKGMKQKFYGKNALLVRCGNWVYNVTSKPEIYYNFAH